MKSLKKLSSLLLLGALLPMFTACEDVNYGSNDGGTNGTDKTGYGSSISSADVTEASLEGQLQSAQYYLIDIRGHKYQYQRSLNIDVYCGYMALTQNFDGRQPTTYYYPNNSFIRGPYGQAQNIFALVAPAINFADSLGRPELAAIGKIMYAYVLEGLADVFGPVAYHDWKVLKQDYPIEYFSAEETYDSCFYDLQTAVDTLKKYQPDINTLRRVEGSETGTPCQWQWDRWVKFANSIQLRMALNIVNVNPVKAQEIAERVVNDEVGVLEDDDDDIAFDTRVNSSHYPSADGNAGNNPLYHMANGWNDACLNASLENICKRYEHPMLEYYFEKNGNDPKQMLFADRNIYDRYTSKISLKAGATCLGERTGIMLRVRSTATENPYLLYSGFRDELEVKRMPFCWLKTVEVLFARAEGALRGWNMGGTAQDFYEAGIRRGLQDVSSVGSYYSYKDKDSKDIITNDYVDYYDSENNIEGRVTVGVKWNDGDDNETKLEKIITQKWIANFPMSLEGWTTWRRTGYPRIFPPKIVSLWTVGTLDPEKQLRRIPWDESPTLADALENYNKYVLPKCEKGSNMGSNPLFWDNSDSWTMAPDGQYIPQNF